MPKAKLQARNMPFDREQISKKAVALAAKGVLVGMSSWKAWQRRVSLTMVSLKLSNVYYGVFRSELPLETKAHNHEVSERLAAVLDNPIRRNYWNSIAVTWTGS